MRLYAVLCDMLVGIAVHSLLRSNLQPILNRVACYSSLLFVRTFSCYFSTLLNVQRCASILSSNPYEKPSYFQVSNDLTYSCSYFSIHCFRFLLLFLRNMARKSKRLMKNKMEQMFHLYKIRGCEVKLLRMNVTGVCVCVCVSFNCF